MKAVLAYDQPTHPKLKSKDAVIRFDEGLIGFSEFKDFVLMENDGLAPKPLAFVTVIIGASPESSTGNFQAPLLVNYDKMAGKQVILTDSSLSVRQPLL